jgi:hypothetical protein
MEIKYTPLTDAARFLPQVYAIYAIRHEPSRMRYVGSTSNISQRLMNWYYLFEYDPNAVRKRKKAKTKVAMPALIAGLLIEHGRRASDWTYAIFDWNKPANYAPRGNSVDRPEYPYIQHMLAQAPHLLLNDPVGKNRGRPASAKRVVGAWGPHGVSPLRYLNVMLGYYPGFKWDKQPPCSRPVDPRVLVPFGALEGVKFAEALRRAMTVPPKHLNPTPAAIDGLYQKWRAAQPAGFDTGLPGTITTAEQALALPDPEQWMKQHLAPAQVTP